MKKLLSALLVGLLAVSVMACSNKTIEGDKVSKRNNFST